jgi:dTDP-4-amino-4,6-dideoxygalactose transaminase
MVLKKLPHWVKLRRRNAEILEKGVKEHPALRVAIPSEDIYNSYYRYSSYIRPERLNPGWDRNRIVAAINAEGIPSFSWNCSEVYLEKAFNRSQKSEVRSQKRLPNAKELGETSLMFLVHPTLTEDDMKDVLKAIDKVMNIAVR